ncbi:DUF819 domain-containing protein [Candidatus Zixiibacteriota bacterium]
MPDTQTVSHALIVDPVAVLCVLATVVFIAVRLEKRFNLFRSLSAALVGILISMLLSNLGIIPGTSPTYEFLVGPGVSVGIALILLSVDIRSILQAGPTMLAAFGIGALGTAIGAVLFGLLLAGEVGPETWKLTGQFTGTYTGGGMNFAALGKALGTSSDLFTAAIAADVIVTAIWMATCLAVPVLLGRPKHSSLSPEAGAIQAETDEQSKEEEEKQEAETEKPATLEQSLHSSGKPVTLSDAAALVMIAVGTVWLAGRMAALLPFLPEVLWLTTIVLLIAQIPAVKKISGGAMWGNYLVLLFLASNGAQSVVANIVRHGPAVFWFAGGTVLIHGIIIFGVGRMLRIDLPTLAVASQANVGGAASAMAMASARGYGDRLLPGVVVGLLGYAIGNYVGYAIAMLMRGWLVL